MIEVAVTPPSGLVAGKEGALAIRLRNTGPGKCSDIVFRLSLPAGCVLVNGRDKVEVETIPAGQDRFYTITIKPRHSGSLELTTFNFQYTDQHGKSVHPEGWKLSIPVQSEDRADSVLSLPRLELWARDAKITAEELDDLEIHIRNTTGISLHSVTMTVSEEPRPHPHYKTARIQDLRTDQTDQASFKVCAPPGKVPVTIHVTYRYQDQRGKMALVEQDYPLLNVIATRRPTDVRLTCAEPDMDTAQRPNGAGPGVRRSHGVVVGSENVQVNNFYSDPPQTSKM